MQHDLTLSSTQLRLLHLLLLLLRAAAEPEARAGKLAVVTC